MDLSLLIADGKYTEGNPDAQTLMGVTDLQISEARGHAGTVQQRRTENPPRVR